MPQTTSAERASGTRVDWDTPQPTGGTPANRLGLDYRGEASRLGPPVTPIIDIHAHINGEHAARIYGDAMSLYGVSHVYSQTRLQEAERVREALGKRIRFVAIPDYMSPDTKRAFRSGWLESIELFRSKFHARIMKIWNAPRFVDLIEGAEGKGGGVDLLALDSPWRIKALEVGERLGMMYMAHIADPDTWFSTKYADASRYGTKRAQYEPLERLLDRFTSPWIVAHMGGWPEDLAFLSGMLERHPNLHLDTSATKWMVRELSRHPREELVAFLTKWKGRILFGSDIVTTDAHLSPAKDGARFAQDLASSPEEAFDLYASRYWALRTMWETDYDGASNIADPDLMMVDPDRYDAMSVPRLRGVGLARVAPDVLESLYSGAARALVERWEKTH
ncbi:MAG: amidohydrolase family protein [Phycisphaerales bacterium]|nr:amidohydrolase family protein [Phycisphaerales bacterium]